MITVNFAPRGVASQIRNVWPDETCSAQARNRVDGPALSRRRALRDRGGFPVLQARKTTAIIKADHHDDGGCAIREVARRGRPCSQGRGPGHQLEQELLDLGLLEYCRGALHRRQQG